VQRRRFGEWPGCIIYGRAFLFSDWQHSATFIETKKPKMSKPKTFGPFRLTAEMIAERTTITEKKLSAYRVRALRCEYAGNDAKARGYYAIIECIKTNYYPGLPEPD
jgi:hypothetical protein